MQKTQILLKEIWNDRKRGQIRYSARSFAKDLGISQSLLSMIMNGQRKLSLAQAAQISARLNLPSQLASRLMRSTDAGRNMKSYVPHGQSFDSKEDVHLNINDVTNQQLNAISHWYALPVLDYLCLAKSDRTVQGVSKALEISILDARDVLRRLEVLGLASQQADLSWCKTKKVIRFSGEKSLSQIRSFHKQMILKSLQQLDKTGDADFQRRSITSTTLTINSRKVDHFFKMVEQFQRDCLKESSAIDADSVYQLNIQFFPLAFEVGKKGGHE